MGQQSISDDVASDMKFLVFGVMRHGDFMPHHAAPIPISIPLGTGSTSFVANTVSEDMDSDIEQLLYRRLLLRIKGCSNYLYPTQFRTGQIGTGSTSLTSC